MTTLFPFWSLGGDHRTLGLAAGVLLGVAFGFVLERAGFGRASKLVGQFYGTDMSVLKVMFTALVTAMVGAVILSGLGLFDLASVQLRYPTFLWPQIVGGLLLGTGFVVSGYCPGTCMVATASGKLDGLATIGGLIVGTLVYAELEQAMGAFTESGALGSFTVPQWLGLSTPAAAALIGVAAVAVFAGATRIERLVRARRRSQGAPAAAERGSSPVPEGIEPEPQQGIG